MEATWVQWASLVFSIFFFLATAVIAVVGWLAKGFFEGIKTEMAAMRVDRETARCEHREDMQTLRESLDTARKDADGSVRRVHARIDEIAKNYVPQAHCVVAMEAAQTMQDKLMTVLQEGHRELGREVMGMRAGRHGAPYLPQAGTPSKGG